MPLVASDSENSIVSLAIFKEFSINPQVIKWAVITFIILHKTELRHKSERLPMDDGTVHGGRIAGTQADGNGLLGLTNPSQDRNKD